MWDDCCYSPDTYTPQSQVLGSGPQGGENSKSVVLEESGSSFLGGKG